MKKLWRKKNTNFKILFWFLEGKKKWSYFPWERNFPKRSTMIVTGIVYENVLYVLTPNFLGCFWFFWAPLDAALLISKASSVVWNWSSTYFLCLIYGKISITVAFFWQNATTWWLPWLVARHWQLHEDDGWQLLEFDIMLFVELLLSKCDL